MGTWFLSPWRRQDICILKTSLFVFPSKLKSEKLPLYTSQFLNVVWFESWCCPCGTVKYLTNCCIIIFNSLNWQLGKCWREYSWLLKAKMKAGRMWSRSCSSFPPDTYACHTYPQEVNHTHQFRGPSPYILRRVALRFSCAPSLSADIVDGNLKSVMRIILALAAHFKPSAHHRAATGSGRTLTRGHASHNPLSPVALAQGAAAALAAAHFDASQPARVPRIHRYNWLLQP